MDERIRGKSAVEMVLSKELSSLLENEDICLIQHGNEGTFFVAKLPSDDIGQIREKTPTQVTITIALFPTAPVIAISTKIGGIISLNAFVNPQDPQQRSDFTDLLQQTTFQIHFYDQSLNYRSTKVVANEYRSADSYLNMADKELVRISVEKLDFDKAKTDIESELIMLGKRKKFKRIHGQEARNLIASNPTFSDKLSELSRKQRRAFYRAVTDLATIEMYGKTHYEEGSTAGPGISRNKYRLRAIREIGFGDELEEFFQLSQVASHIIATNFK